MSLWWADYVMRRRKRRQQESFTQTNQIKVQASGSGGLWLEINPLSLKEEALIPIAVPPDLNNFNIHSNICRVCIKNTGDVSIFEKIESVNISTAIAIIANVTVRDNDEMPKNICHECLQLLRTALTFRKTCEDSDFRLRQIIKPKNNTSSHQVHDFELILHQIKLNRQDSKRKDKNQKMRQQYRMRKLLRQKKLAKKYRCVPCDICFNSSEELLTHREAKQCVRRACPECGKLVMDIRTHQKLIHRRVNRCTCPVCGKEFNLASTLRSHMTIHTNRFDFACELCPYRAKRKQCLKLHVRTHTGERPYLCSHCPARFVNSSNLVKHQLIHGNKMFQCDKCNKTFRFKQTLQEHIDAVHMNMRYKCDTCGKEFCYRSKLLRHEVNMHNRERRKLNKKMTKVIAGSSKKDLEVVHNYVKMESALPQIDTYGTLDDMSTVYHELDGTGPC